jgi:hypothetical protein
LKIRLKNCQNILKLHPNIIQINRYHSDEADLWGSQKNGGKAIMNVLVIIKKISYFSRKKLSI